MRITMQIFPRFGTDHALSRFGFEDGAKNGCELPAANDRIAAGQSSLVRAVQKLPAMGDIPRKTTARQSKTSHRYRHSASKKDRKKIRWSHPIRAAIARIPSHL